MAYKNSARKTSIESTCLQVVQQSAQAGRRRGSSSCPVDDAGGHIRRTYLVSYPEPGFFIFSPYSIAAVSAAIIQHAIHPLPQSHKLPEKIRKGTEVMNIPGFPDKSLREKC